MGWPWGTRYQQAQAREIARLREHNAPLQARVAELEAENARLWSQLSAARKDSHHSSKPPSSDLGKPPRKAGQAFGPPHGQRLELLPRQAHLNADETGHKNNGQRYWIGCFRAASFVVFKIDRSRGTEVLLRLLGQEFQGLLGCDYYAACRKYARQCSVLVQFCLAHRIRDVKYLCEFPDRRVQRYGRRLLDGLRALFHTLHRKHQLSVPSFEAELDQAHARIWRAAIPASGGPFHRLVRNMAERFAKHGDAYFELQRGRTGHALCGH